jgi:1-phosphofructokinase family hexose kinase
MLICVSPNPAVDRRLRLATLARGEVNRAISARPLAGGKAAHVAMAAHSLGEEVMWVGFGGGATGDELESGLCSLGIPVSIVRTRAHTRTNLEVIEPDGTVTEILEPGGEVTSGEVERFLAMCRDIFAEWGEDAQVALSGSLPPAAPIDLYARLTRFAHAHGCRVLLDASGEALRQGLGAGPDLVKPNRFEAAYLTGDEPRVGGSAAGAALRFFAAGARRVAITLGADGLLWQRDAGSAPIEACAPRVEARSAVGCGDTTLAGLAVAFSRGLSDDETVRFAVACGAANCLAPEPGMIDPAEVERLTSVAEVHVARGICPSEVAR